MTLLPRSTTRSRSVKLYPDSTPEPSSSEEDSILYSQHRQRKPKKAKAPTANKVARAPGFCKHCKLPMLGHKKTNCRSLPITDFFVNTVPTTNPPAVEEAESSESSTDTDASGSDNVAQVPDYSQPLDYMPQTSSTIFHPTLYYPDSITPVYTNQVPLQTYYPQAVPNKLIQSGVDDICATYYQNQLNSSQSQINMDLNNLSLVPADTNQPDFLPFGIQPQQYSYDQYYNAIEGLQLNTSFNFDDFNLY